MPQNEPVESVEPAEIEVAPIEAPPVAEEPVVPAPSLEQAQNQFSSAQRRLALRGTFIQCAGQLAALSAMIEDLPNRTGLQENARQRSEALMKVLLGCATEG